jgi:hypothetical protein
MDEGFRTLRGWLEGWERDEEIYFDYSATLRISGDIPDLDEIGSRLGLEPTHTHRKGDKKGPRSPGYKNDMWSYRVNLPDSEPPEKHIDALWSQLKPHKEYLLELKKSLSIDVFMGYRSNNDMAGFEVPSESLEMFTELGISFGVSIVVG